MDRLVAAGHTTINGVAALNPAQAFDAGNVRLDFLATATQPQKDAAAVALAAFDWSDGAQATFVTAALRAVAVAFLSDPGGTYKLARAIADAGRDSDNVLRAWITSFKAAVAASTTLADLKTRVAALANTPPIDNPTLRTAITNRVNDGTVDT